MHEIEKCIGQTINFTSIPFPQHHAFIHTWNNWHGPINNSSTLLFPYTYKGGLFDIGFTAIPTFEGLINETATKAGT